MRQERTRFHAVVFRLAETRFHTVVSRLVGTRRERVPTLVETRLQTHGGWLLPLARLLLDRLSLALLLDALLTRFRRVSDASVSDAFLTRQFPHLWQRVVLHRQHTRLARSAYLTFAPPPAAPPQS